MGLDGFKRGFRVLCVGLGSMFCLQSVRVL